jgi:hypothetical protein
LTIVESRVTRQVSAGAVAAKEVFSRMLDMVDPALVDTAEQTLATTPRTG